MAADLLVRLSIEQAFRIIRRKGCMFPGCSYTSSCPTFCNIEGQELSSNNSLRALPNAVMRFEDGTDVIRTADLVLVCIDKHEAVDRWTQVQTDRRQPDHSMKVDIGSAFCDRQLASQSASRRDHSTV